VKRRLSTIKDKLRLLSSPQQTQENSGSHRFQRKNWLVILLGLLIVIILGGGAAAKATSTTTFCSSCHEMKAEKYTYEVTSHAKLSCTTCHAGTTTGDYLKNKANIIVYISKHLTGKFDQPIVTSDPIKNEVCESCHSSVRKVTPSGDINIPHDKHLQHDISCVACHGGVAHAFVAERGFTKKENLETWSLAKAEEVSKFDETKTAMEACMDCHEQVNQGEKPWEENQGLGKTEKQRVADREETEKLAQEGTGKLPEAVQTIATNGTSELTAPMRCAPCHLKIQTPVNHVDKSWGNTHGITAASDIKWCADCHSRQRDRALITTSTAVKDYARGNTLCAPCHEKRPTGHLASKQQWLPAHSNIVKDKGAQNCLVCHEIDKETQPETNQKIPGVNAVTCNTCHWFKNGKVEY
jgi:cytochrome c-type protein NapC